MLEGANDDGLLEQTFDLLVLARTLNLTRPTWTDVLTLPDYLAGVIQGSGGASAKATPSPAGLSPTPALTASATPGSPIPAPFSFVGTHHFGGTAPSDPWPEPVKMKTKVIGPLGFPPALTDSRVGVATEKGLEAFAMDGSRAFSSEDGGPLVSSPLADAENFYVLRTGALSALDSQGTVVWTFEFDGTSAFDTVLTADNVVFCLESNGAHQVVAVSRETGEVTWQAALADPPASPPIYAETPQPGILVLDDKGNLHAWQAETGSVLWQSSVGQPTLLAPATMTDAMAVCEPSGKVRLLSLADGSQVWEADLGTTLDASPTVTENLVLVPSRDTYLYALDRAGGSIKGKTPLSVPLSSAPVVVGNHVYQCDEQGGVHSLTLPGLKLNWSKSFGSAGLAGPTFSEDFWALLAPDGNLLLYPR